MLSLLHTNDFHGTLDPVKTAFLRELRHSTDALFFDSGDVIQAGNLSIPLKPEIAWERLAEIGCAASVLGNRESHPLAVGFHRKIEGHQHPLLVANLRGKSEPAPVERIRIIEHAGCKVGVFGVMVAIVTERMATQAASAYLWDPPVAVATQVAHELRDQCDLLIALTHIGFRSDCELAEKCPEIDLILGGHSHTVLPEPVQVGRTWIAQGGSHGRFVGIYTWEGPSFRGRLETLPGKDR